MNSSAAAMKSVEPAICTMTNVLRVRERCRPSVVSWRIDRTRSPRVAWKAGKSAGRTPANATIAAMNPIIRTSTGM